MSTLDMTETDALASSLLDGRMPAGDAARVAIDAALHSDCTDRALHAAALWLAFCARSDLRLDRSQPKRWALGLDELVDRGHLDAAAYAAPRLAAAFPRMPYLEHMDLVFRRLPAAADSGRQPFFDDRGSDVQVVAVPGADTAVLAFCGIGHRLGLSLSLIDRWFGQLDAHVIYLRDRRGVGFTGGISSLGPDMESTVQGLDTILDDLGARRVACTGNSAGAYGALRYAPAVHADRVLALCPVTGGEEFFDRYTPYPPPGGRAAWRDLAPLYRHGAGVEVRILYGAQNEADRQQAVRLAGMPQVTVEAIPDWESHHLIGGLLRAGRLRSVLAWLTNSPPRGTTARRSSGADARPYV